jgi:hypothetical protein
MKASNSQDTYLQSLSPLDDLSLEQCREDMLRMVTQFAKILQAEPAFHQSHICPMFNQLNVSVSAYMRVWHVLIGFVSSGFSGRDILPCRLP